MRFWRWLVDASNAHLPNEEIEKHVSCSFSNSWEMIRLLDEILHHLGCINPVNTWIKNTYQLVQDFFHHYEMIPWIEAKKCRDKCRLLPLWPSQGVLPCFFGREMFKECWRHVPTRDQSIYDIYKCCLECCLLWSRLENVTKNQCFPNGATNFHGGGTPRRVWSNSLNPVDESRSSLVNQAITWRLTAWSLQLPSGKAEDGREKATYFNFKKSVLKLLNQWIAA